MYIVSVKRKLKLIIHLNLEEISNNPNYLLMIICQLLVKMILIKVSLNLD